MTIATRGLDAVKLAGTADPPSSSSTSWCPGWTDGLNGWEVCRSLRADPETRTITIIIVPGRGEEGDKVVGLELGAETP